MATDDKSALEGLRDRLLATVGDESNFAAMFAARSFRANRHELELRDAESAAAQAFAAIKAGCEDRGRPDLIDEVQKRWLDRFVRLWAAYQHAGAMTASWAVVGPSNFPVERNRKRMESEDRRRAELLDHIKQARHHAERQAAAVTRKETTPVDRVRAEIADLKARLAKRQAQHAMMKAANEAARKVRDIADEGQRIARFVELATAAGHHIEAQTAATLLRPNYMGRAQPFEAWALSNNSAEMRRLAGRIEQLERKAAAMEAVEAKPESAPAARQIGGVEIVENVAIDRLQIRFPAKPEPAIIQRLKSHGFRWSPSETAWQRQLNNRARFAAEQVARALQEG